jgi:hypothetical protein
MKDIKCPYCNAEQDINHDDGYGYEEGVLHQQHCGHCNNIFVYETCISFDYEVNKADCLNGGEHTWQPTCSFPKEFSQMHCRMCDEVRQPTEDELSKIISGELKFVL